MNRGKAFFRGVLLFLFDIKKNAAEAHRMLADTYGEQAPSERSCREWFARFRSGDFSLQDKEWPGQPKKFEDAELQALLDENSCRTQKELALKLGVAQSTISERLHAMGKIRKLGKWVPHQLNEQQLQARIETCRKYLAQYKKHSFLNRIVTGDEKWVYYGNPKRTAAYVDPGQPGPSQPTQDIHCQKIMLCIWWDQEGVVYYELLNPDETVTAERYRRQLGNLARALNEKRPAIAKKGYRVLFHDDNARPHRANIVKENIQRLGWDQMDQPAYSPDLAPSDYHLFRSMQISLADVGHVRKWVDEWIASKDEDFFRRGIHKLPRRWEELIANDGEYIGN
nr:transposase [Mayetiola destructor]